MQVMHFIHYQIWQYIPCKITKKSAMFTLLCCFTQPITVIHTLYDYQKKFDVYIIVLFYITNYDSTFLCKITKNSAMFKRHKYTNMQINGALVLFQMFMFRCNTSMYGVGIKFVSIIVSCCRRIKQSIIVGCCRRIKQSITVGCCRWIKQLILIDWCLKIHVYKYCCPCINVKYSKICVIFINRNVNLKNSHCGLLIIGV